VHTHAELVDLLLLGGFQRVTASSDSQSGLQLLWNRVGEDHRPPILLTAGSHADEPAGVLALLELSRFLCSVDYPIYVVPVRDPEAYDGFTTRLAALVEVGPGIRDHDDAVEALEQHGDLILRHEDLVIYGVRGQLFGSKQRSAYVSHDMTVRLKSFEREPHRLASMGGNRLTVPGNRPHELAKNGYEKWSHTICITADGVVGNLNRFFRSERPPVSVRWLKHVVDRVRPGWVVDLHEGFLDRSYLYVSQSEDSEYRAGWHALIEPAITPGGLGVSRCRDLARFLTKDVAESLVEIEPGVIAWDGVRDTFAAYCSDRAHAYVVETGMDNPLEIRTNHQAAAVKSLVDLVVSL